MLASEGLDTAAGSTIKSHHSCATAKAASAGESKPSGSRQQAAGKADAQLAQSTALASSQPGNAAQEAQPLVDAPHTVAKDTPATGVEASSGAVAEDRGKPQAPRIKLSVSKARKAQPHTQQETGQQQQQQQQAQGVAEYKSAEKKSAVKDSAEKSWIEKASGGKKTRKQRPRAAYEGKQKKRPAVSHTKDGVTYLKDPTLPKADHDRLMAQVAIIKQALGTDKKQGKRFCSNPLQVTRRMLYVSLHSCTA